MRNVRREHRNRIRKDFFYSFYCVEKKKHKVFFSQDEMKKKNHNSFKKLSFLLPVRFRPCVFMELPQHSTSSLSGKRLWGRERTAYRQAATAKEEKERRRNF